MKRIGGLQRRWLINTVGVMFALGMVCVMLVTAVFATRYYSTIQQDLYDHSKYSAEFLDRYKTSDELYWQNCLIYTQDFKDPYIHELQLIDGDGLLLVSSINRPEEVFYGTAEIATALSTRRIEYFQGKDPSGRRIMAVSVPLINGSGEVLGVMRFVTSTNSIDRQIFSVFGIAMLVLLLVLTAVAVSGHYFLRSMMDLLYQITVKAKRIARGSYGTKIQTKSDDEIGELAEAINELSVKISQNEKMQAGFISQLSHELRTPLTVINGWSETLLADESLDADTCQGLKIISTEASRLTDMVMELLDFTRMQDGHLTLSVEMTDIRGAFEDTVFLYGSGAEKEGIRLHYEECEEEIPEIPCDAQRLRQVFLNILDNAAKHGGSGGRIDTSIGFNEEYVIIRIRDYGPGILEDEIPLVKRKFYRGSSSARGTGIGLAVCDEIVALHGGTLKLENAVGGGALVTVMLPIQQ